ncbi:hypothetical protein Goarm_022893 [Gossypium armourianum]|uniref:Uncharacterized protein n=1 Tax=Gossypium armourianum TaxID=34283 RepID=A0A7J9KFV1_9ROSI|nr:hypothetical protein [Gossypium armourianum]
MEKGFLDKVEDNAAVQTWSKTTQHEKGYSLAEGCFTFGKVNLVSTIEEYMALLQCSMIQVDRVYSRAVNVLTFLKKLINITGMSEQWVVARIKQKGDSNIYGLVVFPKLWGTLIKQSLIYSTDLIRGLHQS